VPLEEKCGWDKGDAHKNEEQEERTDPLARVRHQKCGHYRGNRPARGQVWKCGMGTGECHPFDGIVDGLVAKAIQEGEKSTGRKICSSIS
jgi:hypothetical protein